MRERRQDEIMIKKEMKLVITFYTTTEAMAMEQACKMAAADGRLIPVPRNISAGCGLAWCAKTECEESLKLLMKHNGICPQELHTCLV